MIRERMSRPSSSVPSRCVLDGCASTALKSVADAEYGATHGARIAARAKIVATTNPAIANGRRASRRRRNRLRRARGDSTSDAAVST